ncbi:MAG: hypothetical protein Q7S61_05250 [bacterium]|nr:hypothetical protein [bacterium]
MSTLNVIVYSAYAVAPILILIFTLVEIISSGGSRPLPIFLLAGALIVWLISFIKRRIVDKKPFPPVLYFVKFELFYFSFALSCVILLLGLLFLPILPSSEKYLYNLIYKIIAEIFLSITSYALPFLPIIVLATFLDIWQKRRKAAHKDVKIGFYILVIGLIIQFSIFMYWSHFINIKSEFLDIKIYLRDNFTFALPYVIGSPTLFYLISLWKGSKTIEH